MFGKGNLAELQARLDQVNAELDSHPFNSAETKTKNAIVEQHKLAAKENQTSVDTQKLNTELVSQNFPTLEQGGKSVATGLLGFSRLNRERHKLEKKIEKLKRKG